MPQSGLSDGIVKAARNRVKEALDALDEIDMADDKHIKVPWEITPRPKLDSEVWSDSAIVSVKIEDLFASQRLLKKKRVDEFIRTQGAPEEGHRALANVYAIDGRNVIVDGHHRLAALWLLGAEVANVWYLED